MTTAVATPFNPMAYESKADLMRVVRKDRQTFYDIVDVPSNWEVDTRCEGWQVRDLVGHMIDVTEGYLKGWDYARKGEEAPAPIGLPAMGKLLNEHALAFRSLSREEAINRLKTQSDQMLGIFDATTEDEYGNFTVPHPYMGPLPPFFYPAFHVIDYGVHTWDMRYGLGDKLARLDEDTAGMLIPYMFIVFQYTVDPNTGAGLNARYGLEITGPWGGRWVVNITDGQWAATPHEGAFRDVDATFTFDPSDFVLTAYQRFDGGAARGDHEVINKVRHLLFAI
jgi:uncharacterized protein (TIGR03083 family)